jgi:3',5'-cyclic AMP phosphodiesterase CpdA
VIRIAHLSDLHYDRSRQLRVTLERLVKLVADSDPDLVVVTGDLSADGRTGQLDEVRDILGRLDRIPMLVVPGNRDLEPSAGPPGESQPLPVDSDLDFFLALEPALALGFEDEVDAESDPAARFVARFGPTEPVVEDHRFVAVGVQSTPKLSSESLARAARRLRRSDGEVRIFALHHGLLPVPGRKLRDGDLVARAGDVLSLLCDLRVDLVLHGHVHRANVWRLSDARGDIVVASAGALVNDGRHDASFLEIVVDGNSIEVDRRSVATGRATPLFASGDVRASRGRSGAIARR